MKDLRDIIARNLVELRTKAGMTQAALAAKLNYSDKAVSKWERAESIPDIAVLKEIADLFGVSVDYLLTEEHRRDREEEARDAARRRKNRNLVSFLSAGLIWLVATALFVCFAMAGISPRIPLWMIFIYAIPVSVIVFLIFNSIWGKRVIRLILISLLLWSSLLAVFLTLLFAAERGGGLWMIFLLGIPAEILIFLWSGLAFGRKKQN